MIFVEIQGVSSRHIENSQARCKTGVHPAEFVGRLERQSESVDLRDETEAGAPQANRPSTNEWPAKAVWRFARGVFGKHESGDSTNHEELHSRDQPVRLAPSGYLPCVGLTGGDQQFPRVVRARRGSTGRCDRRFGH